MNRDTQIAPSPYKDGDTNCVLGVDWAQLNRLATMYGECMSHRMDCPQLNRHIQCTLGAACQTPNRAQPNHYYGVYFFVFCVATQRKSEMPLDKLCAVMTSKRSGVRQAITQRRDCLHFLCDQRAGARLRDFWSAHMLFLGNMWL